MSRRCTAGLDCLWLLALLLAAVAPLLPRAAGAQASAEPAAQSRPAEAPPLPPDPLNRRNPQEAVFGLLAALAEQDYQRAAQYMDLSGLPKARREAQGALRARQLQAVLDHAGWIQSPRQLSESPDGHLDDGLAPELERFAAIRAAEGRVDLLLERSDHPELGLIWLVAADTVAALPALAAGLDAGLLERLLPEQLIGGPRLAGAPLGQWLVLLVVALLSYLLAWLLIGVALRVATRGLRRARSRYVLRFLDSSLVPLRLFAAVWIFSLAAFFLGASIIARQYFGIAAEVVAWLALAWLAWRLIDSASEASLERLTARGQLSARSALHFFRRSAKVVLGAIAVMTVLETLGYDVSTALAALGIGGIALALGAQKTVENLVGGLSLIADRPMRVGDFCRVGDIVGTVEDIGMRSTRIRTLDRTIITVPNGELSAQKIENFAQRDRFWFHPLLRLRYDTSPDQIRYLLVEIRALLYAHPRVNPNPARVRFVGLDATSLDLEVFAYLDAKDGDEFLEIQEDLFLRIMETVEKSGTGFALPAQTVFVGSDPGIAQDKAREAREKLREWVEQGELQLPNFRPERIEALRNSIPYPPQGSAQRGGDENR